MRTAERSETCGVHEPSVMGRVPARSRADMGQCGACPCRAVLERVACAVSAGDMGARCVESGEGIGDKFVTAEGSTSSQ
jgi:hypothetical protein